MHSAVENPKYHGLFKKRLMVGRKFVLKSSLRTLKSCFCLLFLHAFSCGKSPLLLSRTVCNINLDSVRSQLVSIELRGEKDTEKMTANNSATIRKLQLKGAIAAPFTPFHENGEVNFDIMEEYADRIVANGVTCVFVNGTTGEGMSMSVAERKAATERWIALGRTRFEAVIVHVGAANMKDAQELAKHAEEHGAHAISTLPPLFFKPSNVENMICYLEEIASAAPHTPFFYYHNPSMVGTSSAAFSLEDLAEAIFSSKRIPTLCGMKYSSPNLHQYGRCIAKHAHHCQFMYGCDQQLLPSLTLGGEAFIGSTYNYLGRVAGRLLKAFNAGDILNARKEQFRIQALVSVLIKYGGHVGANKAIMSLVGPEMGPARSPLHNPSPEERTLIRKDLEAIGFFEWIQ